jgi:branched-chain amino acid aminotransferase
MKNKHANARIRLMVFRGEGAVFDPVNHHPNFIIQTWELPAGKPSLNEHGLGYWHLLRRHKIYRYTIKS